MANRSRFITFLVRSAVLGTGILLIGFLALFLVCMPDSTKTVSEQYEVFSAYLSQGLTGESHSLGDETGEVVIDGGTMPWRFAVSMLRELCLLKRESPLSTTTPLFNLLFVNWSSEQLQRSFALPARYELITRAEVSLYPTMTFQRRFPGNYGYHRFTKVGFNRTLTEAVFYTDHICGLCGEGKYVYMKKRNGKWSVVGTFSRWIS